MDTPVLVAFPLKGRLKGMVKVWCPYCKVWHHHGSGSSGIGKDLGHRTAHCGIITTGRGTYDPHSPFEKTGYYLKLVSKKDLKEIAF